MEFLFLNSKAHLLLERSSSDVSGGAELQVALLAMELAKRGYTTAIVHGSDRVGEARRVAGVECFPGGPFHTGAIRDVYAALGPVFNTIQTQRPRYVLVLGWTAWLFLLWLMRPMFRYRLIFICGLDTEADGRFAKEHGLRGRLFDFAMRRSDLIYAMSEEQRRLFGARGMKCALYRNLVLWPEKGLQEVKEIDLLWIARCRPIKRPLLFLELARRLPQARCVMVCPPEDKELFGEVSKQAEDLPNVQLIEFVPYHEVQSYYNRARLFVNTSTAEGFANSFIQAGLGGAAILSLAVDCDGVLDRFKAGVCVDDDFEALVSTARTLLFSNEAMLSAYAAGAGRFVQENHGTEQNVGAFLSGLKEIER